MSINIGPASVEELRPKITVIGVGGAGGNAISNMIESEIEGVDFVVANTDAQALNNALAEHRIQLGPDITQGLGAGSRPEVGRAAAEETVAEIERALEGVNMVFIAAGMGGGTGTGAAPVIAEVARSKGILTVGVVTKPFLFEGTRRMRSADAGIEELQKYVDTLIVIPNQNLFLVAKADTTFKEAFMLADEVLQQGVRSITDLMVMPGLINLDFADVRSVMNEMGKAMMGTGEGEGENRALEAAERAIANPLLDGVSMHGAKGVIISIIGGDDMRLLEVDEAANHIREMVDPEANIIWGSAFNPDLQGKIRVSVVATGIENSGELAQAASRPLDLSSVRGPKMPAFDSAPAAAAPLAMHDPLDLDDEFDDEDDDEGPAPTLDSFLARQEAEPEDVAEVAIEDDDDDAEGAATWRASEEGSEVAPTDAASAWDDADEDDDNDDDDGVGESLADDGAEQVQGSEAQETLDLSDAASENLATSTESEANNDELLLDATRLADADDEVQPLSRRQQMLGAAARAGAVSDGDGEDAGSTGAADSAAAPQSAAATNAKPEKSGGSTLFERMANLSRGGGSSDDSDDDEESGGGVMRIPRFLGRQNNQ